MLKMKKFNFENTKKQILNSKHPEDALPRAFRYFDILMSEHLAPYKWINGDTVLDECTNNLSAMPQILKERLPELKKFYRTYNALIAYMYEVETPEDEHVLDVASKLVALEDVYQILTDYQMNRDHNDFRLGAESDTINDIAQARQKAYHRQYTGETALKFDNLLSDIWTDRVDGKTLLGVDDRSIDDMDKIKKLFNQELKSVNLTNWGVYNVK